MVEHSDKWSERRTVRIRYSPQLLYCENNNSVEPNLEFGSNKFFDVLIEFKDINKQVRADGGCLGS
jgi:hypothetical protein